MKITFLLFLLVGLSTSIFAQQNVTGSFEHDGATREYRLRIPPGYEAGMSLPLVINMHGYGSSNVEQELYSGFNTAADANGFFVVYPQGLDDNLGTPHWNAYFNSTVDDVGFLSLLIDYLYTDYDIDLSRVYSTGMSNGGFMSYRLACELSDRIAAIASVTGTMSFAQIDNCPIERPIPIMQIHGTADAVVPYGGQANFYPPITDIIDFWTTHNACETPVETMDVPDINMGDNSIANFEQYDMCGAGTEVIFYTIENGGHSWPGAFPVPGLGNTNQDIDATTLIWEFFDRFTHPSPAEGMIISSQKEVIADNLIQLFPNPFSDYIILKFNAPEAKTIQIFDAAGRLTKTEQIAANTSDFALATSHLETGIYIIKISSETGVWNKKIIKQ